MSRYYFDVHTAERLVVDEVGEDLDTVDLAVQVAIALLQCSDLGEGGTVLDATVRDHTGRAVVIATLDIRIQRLAENVVPHLPARSTPALIERSRALSTLANRNAAELTEAVSQSSLLLRDMKRRLSTPKLPPPASAPAGN